MRKLSLLIVLISLAACQKKETPAKKEIVKDAHSFSNPAEAVVKHLDLDIKVDFDTQTISGKASWQIDNSSKGNEIIFDELCAGLFKDMSRYALGDIARDLKEAGAEAVILGCTELPLVMKDGDIGIPYLDTTRLHALAAVEFILE